MQLAICFRLIAALVAVGGATGVSARFLADFPPATRLSPLLAERQQTATSVPTSTYTPLPPDPWQCITENITQCFDVPKPTGAVNDAINSYMRSVAAPCRATATGYDRISCTISDPKSWCGFTTAAPASVLPAYSSSYLSAAVSFWTAKSSRVSVLSTSCPAAWGRYSPLDYLYLGMAAAHADCYLAATGQPRTSATTPRTGTTTSTVTTTGPRTTTASAATMTRAGANVAKRAQGVEPMAWMSAGLAFLANAV